MVCTDKEEVAVIQVFSDCQSQSSIIENNSSSNSCLETLRGPGQLSKMSGVLFPVLEDSRSPRFLAHKGCTLVKPGGKVNGEGF